MRRISKSLVLLTFFALFLARANAVEPVDQDREFCTAGVIEDATTHKTWSVVRNMEHPAWPARLIEMRGENEQPCFSHEDMRKEGPRFELTLPSCSLPLTGVTAPPPYFSSEMMRVSPLVS